MTPRWTDDLDLTSRDLDVLRARRLAASEAAVHELVRAFAWGLAIGAAIALALVVVLARVGIEILPHHDQVRASAVAAPLEPAGESSRGER